MVDKKGVLCVISGPSGSGKSTLVEALLEKIDTSVDIRRVITYTTKKPRSTEVQGRDYHFVSVDEFRSKIEEGFFIEWSQAYGNYYGSPISILKEVETGTSYVAILDQQGACAVQDAYPQAILIWISVPDIEVLRERLYKRGTEKTEEIEKRLKIAHEEIENEQKKYHYDYYVINDSIDRSAAELQDIVEKELLKN